MKLFGLGSGVGIADGLVDPGAAGFRIRKGLAGELAAFFLRHGEDLIGDVRVQRLQTRKLFRLGLIKLQKREFECFGERCHGGKFTPVLHVLARFIDRGLYPHA